MTKTRKVLESGWSRVKFGDVVRVSKERCQDPLVDGVERFIGLEHIDPEDLRIKRWGNVADGITFTNVFKPGQVLFGKRRAYQRKVAVADFSGVCSGDIYVLESRDATILLPELLPFICQTEAFFEHAVGTSAGSLSPRTNWKSLAEFEFALPPMDKQKCMTHSFGVLEENLTLLSAASTAAHSLELSRLEDALASVSKHGLVPVEQLVTTGPKNGLSPKVNADERGYPTLSISAVRGGRIVTEGNVKYAEVTENQAAAFELKANDVLVVRGNGNKMLTGQCGIVGTVPLGCFYPDLLICLKFDAKIIRPEFAALQWNAPSTHRRLISRAKTTNGIWKINGSDIRKHTLKVPSIEDQDISLEEIRTIRQARVDIERRKATIQALKVLALNEIS